MPLTAIEKRIVFSFAIAIGLTRLLAISASLMDWDEALFSLALQDYDVTGHRPHPPGYPVFVAAARLVHLLGVSEFRSVQTIVVLGAIAIFPSCFAFARELGMPFPAAVGGATIFAFLPNVWIYGGTGFSDVPATAMVLAAAALLLRGRFSDRAFVAGAVVLALAAGMRPTNLLLGAIPAVMATVTRLRARSYGAVALGLVLGTAIAGGSYAAAALASHSVEGFVEAVEGQGAYVRQVDSWRNPERAPLSKAARIFLFDPFRKRSVGNALMAGILIASVYAILRRRPRVAILLGMYAPLAILSWLNFDIATASRYAVNYMALHALLTADAAFSLGRTVFRRSARAAMTVGAALSALLVGWMTVWSFDAVTLQRTRKSPPVAALEWVAGNVPEDAPVYVDGALAPHARFILPHSRWEQFESADEIPATDATWVVHAIAVPSARQFVWPRDNPLWKITRPRNFEASIGVSSSLARFREGWYSAETDGVSEWRWMSRTGRVQLGALPGRGRLILRFGVPLDALAEPPVVTVTFNGRVVASFRAATPETARTFDLESLPGRPNELIISTSATVVPARVRDSGDTRELGLVLRNLSWRALP